MRLAASAVLFLSLCGAGAAHAAPGSFLCSPNLPGEAQIVAPNCIEIVSFSDAAYVEGQGVEVRDMRFTKYRDITTALLRRYFVLGLTLPTATFQQYKTTGPQLEMYAYVKLFDAKVTSMAADIGEAGDALEAVSVTASKIEYMYRRQTNTGELLAPAYQCWNRVNRTITTQQCP